MFHKNQMGSIIRSTGTVFYSLLYVNSRQGPHGLKYVYSVISVIVDSLPANTKNRESLRSWTARVQLVDSWAAISLSLSFWIVNLFVLAFFLSFSPLSLSLSLSLDSSLVFSHVLSLVPSLLLCRSLLASPALSRSLSFSRALSFSVSFPSRSLSLSLSLSALTLPLSLSIITERVTCE